MKKFLVIMLGLILLFSCNDENGVLNKEETQVDTIRNTTCFNFDYDFEERNCKDEICDTGICITYENIWKEILLEMNNLDNEYFNNHITLCETYIHEWNDGSSFGVCYILSHNWAKTFCCDAFIIKINGDNTYYPSLYLPREKFLSKSEIYRAINFKAFSSHITKISNLTEVKFNSTISALRHLIDSAKVDTLCYKGIRLNKESGNINLEAYGEYVGEYNSCIFGYIDLFTGETKTEDWPCFIED